MICPKCSRENLTEVEFCSYCRASIKLRKTRTLSELTTEEIVAIIESDLHGAYPPQGNSLSKSDGPDAIWRVTGIPDKYFNNVTYVNWPSTEATHRVKRLVEELDSYEIDYSWWISPSSSPDELPKILEAHSMIYQEDFPGMAIDLRYLRDQPSELSGIEDLKISRINNKDELDEFTHTFTVATNSNPEIQSGLTRLLNMSGYGQTDDWAHYAGTLHGKTVATTSVFTGAGVAGIYLVSTIPEARNRKIATTIVKHVLKQAREAGYNIGTLQSSKEGLGLYLKLGFREYCRFPFYTRYPLG